MKHTKNIANSIVPVVIGAVALFTVGVAHAQTYGTTSTTGTSNMTNGSSSQVYGTTGTTNTSSNVSNGTTNGTYGTTNTTNTNGTTNTNTGSTGTLNNGGSVLGASTANLPNTGAGGDAVAVWTMVLAVLAGVSVLAVARQRIV